MPVLDSGQPITCLRGEHFVRSFHNSLAHLDVFMGDMCNLKCTSCPCWMVDNPPNWDSALLTDKFAEMVDYIEAACPSFDRMMVIGGEPFLHGGVLDYFRHQSANACISAYTNLAWESDDTFVFRDNVRFFTSLDAHTDELYRRVRRGRTFDFVTANLARFADRIAHVDTTVSKLNLPYMREIFAMTEDIGCTHWFMPMDARVSYYAQQIEEGNRPATERENLLAQRTSHQLERILLEPADLPTVTEFYEQHATRRTNDVSAFERLYRAGVSHYAGEDETPRGEPRREDADQPGNRCETLKAYMEVTFARNGNYIPFIHCPTLRHALKSTEGPEFSSFAALMAWEEEVRASVTCSDACSRTPYLKVDALRVWGANSAKLGRKEPTPV